jgi:hypothetical protein
MSPPFLIGLIMNSAQLIIDPLLPLPWLLAAVLVLLAIAVLGFRRRARGNWLRLALGAALILIICNPALLREARTPNKDIAAVIIDDSASQQINQRPQQITAATLKIQEQLELMPDLETRITHVSGMTESNIIQSLQQTMADVPERRIAGTLLITDGQIHDLPASPDGLSRFGPVHVLLTGKPDEIDRRLTVVRAPAFGMVGQKVMLTVQVDDQPQVQSSSTIITLRYAIDKTKDITVPVGQPVDIELPVDHPGSNVFELLTDPLPEELTAVNNRVALDVQGIRERLRVLLVSGTPHPGERTWRNLLKADPAVELVHFTILRPPEKQDATPLNEMSLIAFPVRELFEVKLKQFDLIIFDRVKRQGILPEPYLQNIADYVRAGGAFLDVSGAGYAGVDSLFNTPLKPILPAEPTGRIIEQRFTPQLTELGQRHPITANLLPPQGVGNWWQQVDAKILRGMVLMNGAEGKPLFIMDHVGEGRVGQMLSDQIWLWSRNYDGGGPQAELLRRLAHWLMREPHLEEESLQARVQAQSDGYNLQIERQSLEERIPPITLIDPDGRETIIEMLPGERPGVFAATHKVMQQGIYRLRDDSHYTAVPVGSLQAPEWQDMRASDQKIAALVKTTDGGVLWLAHNSDFSLRRTSLGARQHGADWLGLKRNGDYVVTGATAKPILPAWIMLTLLLGLAALTWWREGR